MMRKTLVIIIGIIFIAAPSGCSKKVTKDESKDIDVYQMAKKLITDEQYRDGISVLKKLINDYPASPLLEKAYFEVGRAYYLDEENVDAEVALDDFMRLYPGSNLIPQALLLKGKTIERYKEKPGRDQSYTSRAMEVYNELTKDYSSSREAKEAAKRVIVLRNDLAKHELLIAKFYIKTKKFSSAEKRLKVAYEKYSDTNTAPELVNLLAKTYVSRNRVDDARKLLEIMEEYYPDREETSKLKQEIEGAAQ